MGYLRVLSSTQSLVQCWQNALPCWSQNCCDRWMLLVHVVWLMLVLGSILAFALFLTLMLMLALALTMVLVLSLVLEELELEQS